jgi:hypothetical protein
LDYLLGTQSRGDDARSTGRTSRPLRKTNQSWFSAHPHIGHRERFHRPGNITLEGVQNSSKGSGATPVGSLVRPHGSPTIKYSLHSSASAQMEALGLLSRISVRGTLTDAHIENIRMQVVASNSTPYPVVRTVLDDHSLEHEKSILRINQGSSAGCRRIRKQARTNQETSSARTPLAA